MMEVSIMGLMSRVFIGILGKKTQVRINSINETDYVFYKIVDQVSRSKFLLQCINTEAVFRCGISEIVFDAGIIYRLHPIQACYIGIQYAGITKYESDNAESDKKLIESFTGNLMNRYGSCSIEYIDRKGDICFKDEGRGERFIMDPRDIALSEQLIKEFDASQAFYIGFWAAQKMSRPVDRKSEIHNFHLRLVK